MDSRVLVKCMPENESLKFKNINKNPNKIIHETESPDLKIDVVNGEIETPTDNTKHMPQKWILSSSVKCIYVNRKPIGNRIAVK